jgi:hypothetical protein
MEIVWGVIVIVLALPCWGGQVISWFSPALGTRLKLVEAEESVEPTYYADIRGEALWDTLTLWTMPAAGALLIADSPAWPYFGIGAGAVFIYFAGRGIATRRAMQLQGFRIGKPENVTTAYAALTIWGATGAVTLAAAAVALSNT